MKVAGLRQTQASCDEAERGMGGWQLALQMPTLMKNSYETYRTHCYIINIASCRGWTGGSYSQPVERHMGARRCPLVARVSRRSERLSLHAPGEVHKVGDP